MLVQAVDWLSAPFGFAGVVAHDWKSPAAISVARLAAWNALRWLPPALAVSQVQIVRVSDDADTAAVSWVAAEDAQFDVLEMAPVDRSIEYEFRSPVQTAVEYWPEYAALSPATGCRLLVATAAAEPTVFEIAASCRLSAVSTAVGSPALRYTPWPLTAACHRSSMSVESPLLLSVGVGQDCVPATILL